MCVCGREIERETDRDSILYLGLYSSDGAVAYYHNVSEGATGKLLLADLDIHPRKSEVLLNAAEIFA